MSFRRHKKTGFRRFFYVCSLAFERRRQVRCDCGQHGLEAFGVARNDVAFLEEVVTTGEIADQTACFLNQQSARCHVPFGQARLPERIEATGSDISQVEACSACAADAGGLAYQAAEHAQVVLDVVHLVVTEREAGAEQCAFQALALADAQTATVQGSAATTAGGEFFLADRVQNNGVLKATAIFAGDADSKVRDAANEVGSAVQRVDDPQVVGAFAAAFVQAAFFAKDAVSRVGLAQSGNDALFGGAVDLCDVVLGFFFVNLDGIQALDGAENQFAGAAGGAQRDIQHGLHGQFT
ncbi:hypothetical protein ALP98_05473 [Pseudomonas viridiflava]|uniref:Uncharacterized protein n=1 Tax=Pseudomonas viridiflava TaxID=33069 RepID=A0A3M4NT94_PSEVI|nr:hypothetical protein ALP98_05473 [Pseudomonas viridiflava]